LQYVRFKPILAAFGIVVATGILLADPILQRLRPSDARQAR
jgi:hypothetical protein